MSRLSSAGLVVTLLLLAGGLLWWLRADPATSYPSQAPVEGLSEEVSIGWTNETPTEIEADNAADALTALGYVHGMNRGWTVALWRRTALGSLASWLGRDLVSLDRHARRLGLAHHAREAYDRLSETDRQHLEAYSKGLNAALRSDRVRNEDPFVVLGVTPEPWEPWHTLAIERLLAWMATSPSSVHGDGSEIVSDFRRTDLQFRRWLHLHGWNRSVAWAARPPADTARTLLFARHVLGSSAEPIVQETTIRRPDASPLVLASLPGAPLFPTGTTGEDAWTLLLSSPADLTRTAVDTSLIEEWYERLAPSDGDEQLVRIRRHDGNLLLSPSFLQSSSETASPLPTIFSEPSPQDRPGGVSVSPDSAWVLEWNGLSSLSDISAWTSTARLRATTSADRDPPSFDLFRNEGLEVDASGEWTVRGQPPIIENDPAEGTVLVGRSPWARHQAQSLRAQHASSPYAGHRWSASDSSTWAANLLPELLAALAPLSDLSPYREALTYLRNWDYVYEPTSIGASLFDQWMQSYRREIGRIPVAPDTTYLAPHRRRQAFRRAVDTLATRYGSDVRRWRWERIAPDRRFFPVWSADSLVGPDLSPLSTTRYAPLDRPGRGHPSALSGGPSLVDPPSVAPAPTHWEGWIPNGQSALTVRRLRFDPSVFLARSLMQEGRPSPLPISQAEREQRTVLVPNEP